MVTHVGPALRERRCVTNRAAIPRAAPHPRPPEGPGREKSALASTAKIRPRPAASGRLSSAAACATAPSRSNPHGMKTVTSTCLGPDLVPGEPARPGTGVGEDRHTSRRLHLVGDPVPGVERWVLPTPTPVPGAGPVRAPVGAPPPPGLAGSPSACPPRSPVPVAAPTMPTQSMTSSSRPGSSETTWAWHPITSSASSTAPDGTAQTWQRSWARIRSGSMARIRASSSV